MRARSRTLAVCCLLAMLAAGVLGSDLKKEQNDRARHAARKEHNVAAKLADNHQHKPRHMPVHMSHAKRHESQGERQRTPEALLQQEVPAAALAAAAAEFDPSRATIAAKVDPSKVEVHAAATQAGPRGSTPRSPAPRVSVPVVLASYGGRCPKGLYVVDDECVACEDYRMPSDCQGCKPPEQCRHLICPPGQFRGALGCELCAKDSYSEGGLVFQCTPCAAGRSTPTEGSTSEQQCACPQLSFGLDCGECPANMMLLDDGTCGCKAGYGGATCEPCQPNFYSNGGDVGAPFPKCETCGLHLTSPPAAPSIEYCQCEAGFGADRTDVPMGERQCVPCEFGSYNPGDVSSLAFIKSTVGVAAASPVKKKKVKRVRDVAQILPCRQCSERNPEGAFTTVEVGSRSASQCICKPGYGGFECAGCGEGTYSLGGKDAACQSCPNNAVGFTTNPLVSSTSVANCLCKPGYGMTDEFTCKRCPPDTYSTGTGREACSPCPFGTTSAAGAGDVRECRSVAQWCPAGQAAPEGAISARECSCLPGYGGGATPDAPCTICPAGFFSPGRNLEQCKPCKFGYTSAVGSTTEEECRPLDACPAGTELPPNAVGASSSECRCKPGYGSATGSAPCSICPAGFFGPGRNLEACKPCKFGYTSAVGSTTEEECRPLDACPAGTELPPNAVGASSSECRCKPGYGSVSGSAPCRLCPVGTFSEGWTMEDCKPCKFGFISAVGSVSSEECQPSPQACPIGQWAPGGSVAAAQCLCYPGFGAGDSPSDPCTLCPAGTYSEGKSLEKCMPCGFGMTSPAGSKTEDDCRPVNQCPAGTAPKPETEDLPFSVEDCACKQGYGSATGAAPCHLCPVGTFSEGGTYEACKPCQFGTTSAPGASDSEECVETQQACPQGQIAPPWARTAADCVCKPGWGGGETAKEACKMCPAGTWSPGNSTETCIPCGFGHTSPAGSTSEDACYAINACPTGTEVHRMLGDGDSLASCVCKAGFGSVPGQGICRICPADTFAYGGSLEECTPCPFGTTSAPGSTGEDQCKKSATPCPTGMEVHLALGDGVTMESCVCKAGFGSVAGQGICRICPTNTFAAGGSLEECTPCPFGTTSAPGSTSEDQCRKSASPCPTGMEIHRALGDGDTLESCVCKPGFGAVPGNGICRVCPSNTFANGGSLEECTPCPFGTISAPGSTAEDQCKASTSPCPIGQAAPPGAVGAEQCACLPGYGGGLTPSDACSICPVGTWAAGGTTERCMPCGFGLTSPEGSVDASDCIEANACPAGTDYRSGPDKAFSLSDCVCKRGYGSPTGSGVCRLCPEGTFSSGGSMEDCKPCGFGYTSTAGAVSFKECRSVAQACPIGQRAPEDAASAAECACYPGFGGGDTPTDPCTICPAGTYSANKGTERCKSCPKGYTSPEGSDDEGDCHPDEECPAGATLVTVFDRSKACKCKPGFGSLTGVGICRQCPVGFYSEGYTMEDCKPCPFGTTSKAGSANADDDCVPVAQPCPVGQIAPPYAVSAEQCACVPGFGGGNLPTSPCTICPAGTFNPGGNTQHCIPCGLGYTSPEGASSRDECISVNACPAGSEYDPNVAPKDDFSLARCMCKKGYGVDEEGVCRLCKPGTYGVGGADQPCKPCGQSWTSEEGSSSWSDCYQELDNSSPKDEDSARAMISAVGGAGNTTTADTATAAVMASPNPTPEAPKTVV